MTTPRSKTAAYSRRYDKLRRCTDYRALVDGTVARRQMAALQALGYSLEDQGRRIGRTQQSMSRTFHKDELVHITTVKAIAALYGRLHHTPAPGPYAHRTRLRAVRLGYAPPAAYDDISDITERPKGVKRV